MVLIASYLQLVVLSVLLVAAAPVDPPPGDPNPADAAIVPPTNQAQIPPGTQPPSSLNALPPGTEPVIEPPEVEDYLTPAQVTERQAVEALAADRIDIEGEAIKRHALESAATGQAQELETADSATDPVPAIPADSPSLDPYPKFLDQVIYSPVGSHVIFYYKLKLMTEITRQNVEHMSRLLSTDLLRILDLDADPMKRV